MNLSSTFLSHFEALEDPRLDNHNLIHNFTDILVITILGTICGADGWAEIEQFGIAKYQWLKTFLPLPHGIPSHDTFGRVFAALDPQKAYLGPNPDVGYSSIKLSVLPERNRF